MIPSVLRGHESAWIAGMVAKVPRQWRRRVAESHAGRLAERGRIPEREFSIARQNEITAAAHSWLSDAVGAVGRLRVPVDISDADLCAMAEEKAREAMSLAGGHWLKTMPGIRGRLSQFAEGYGIKAPALPYLGETGKPAGVEDGPAIARLTCPLWWRRGLRKVQARELEAAAIRLGYVHRAGELYASNATVTRRGQQNRRNAAAMESTYAVNVDTGEELKLSELAAASVANPVIRRGELMARIAGFEFVARAAGHLAEFITLTCPTRYHAKKMQAGRPVDNPAWDGSTPRDAQQYLTRLWANARAALWRRGIRPYGFRIAEPHHDGTPHWHLLLFLDPVLSVGRASVGRFRALLRRYALRVGADEVGAKKYRIKFDRVAMGSIGADGKERSAAGYVLKYVSKNIDGFQVQEDLEGMAGVESSQRVAAWAAAWGIRQFQQIGGPPVGVWRELRRMPDGVKYSATVEAARVAADCGPRARARGGEAAAKSAEHWAAFVGVMGGPVARRVDMPVGLAKTAPGVRFHFQTGELFQAPAGPGAAPSPIRNRYGEISPGVVYGVRDVAKGQAWASERGRWEIKRGRYVRELERGLDVGRGHMGDFCGAGRVHVGNAAVISLAPAFPAPRTRGNNCSRGGWPDASGLVGDARRPGPVADLMGLSLAAALAAPEKIAWGIWNRGGWE